jgi:hypothetical protein
MAIARARPTNNHELDGEVLFFSDVNRPELFISESVKLCEGHSQVCNFFAVRVEPRRFELDIRREDSIKDLKRG